MNLREVWKFDHKSFTTVQSLDRSVDCSTAHAPPTDEEKRNTLDPQL